MYLLAYTFIIDFVYFYINFIAFKTSANLLFEYVWMNFLIYIFFFFNFFIKFVASCWLFLLANCDTHIVGTITSFFFLKFRFIEWTVWIYCSLKAIEIMKSDLETNEKSLGLKLAGSWLFKNFLVFQQKYAEKDSICYCIYAKQKFYIREFMSIQI